MCPDLDAFEKEEKPLQLGLAGEHQRCNAALALQLARTWLDQQGYLGKSLLNSFGHSTLEEGMQHIHDKLL